MISSRLFIHALVTGFFILTNSFIVAPADLRDDVLSYTNQFRRANGLPPLQMREDLNEMARKHSEDMAKGKTPFGHDGFDNRYDKIKRKFQSCTAAENVAYGSTTGQQVVTEWKNSAPHRRNMLGNYKYIGIGISRDRNGRLYYTQIFVG